MIFVNCGTFSLTSLTASQGVKFTGQSSSYSGYSVAVGDLNNDNIQDVIIGAPNYGSGTGRIYIVTGSSSLITVTLPSSYVPIDGKSSNNAGFSLAVVDYNNDGKDDLIITGFLSSSSSNQLTYVLPGPITSSLSLATSSPITISSQTSNSYWVGFSASTAGYMNSDMYEDFLLAGGQVFLVYGAATLNSFSVPSGTSSGVIVFSTSAAATFVVDGGTDINGDNIPDLLFGNNLFTSNTGVVYLVYGSRSLSNLNLDSMTSTVGVTISGISSGDRLGSSVAFLGDFNGDGNNDFAISAPYSGNGKVYIIFGLSGGAKYSSGIILSSLGSGGVIFTGSTGQFGNSISSVADVTNDGKCEVLIGNAVGSKVYLIYGTASTTSLSTSAIATGGSGYEISGDTESVLTTFYTTSNLASGTNPTIQPTSSPSSKPTIQPTSSPSSKPTIQPTSSPSSKPTIQPTSSPSSKPTIQPTSSPSSKPTIQPTSSPSSKPTIQPTSSPSSKPTIQPTSSPSSKPTIQPTSSPSSKPTHLPSRRDSFVQPSLAPFYFPTLLPSLPSLNQASFQPSTSLANRFTFSPTALPTLFPTFPHGSATNFPTVLQSTHIEDQPSYQPFQSNSPSNSPTLHDTITLSPFFKSTNAPTTRTSQTPTVNPSLPSLPPSSACGLSPNSVAVISLFGRFSSSSSSGCTVQHYRALI
eukprot:gene4820-5174_t